jgi:hypothetical protein
MGIQTRVSNSRVLTLPDNEIAIGNLIQDPSSWKETLHSVKDKISFDEKIHIAAKMGGIFSDRYNEDRANRVGSDADGIVSVEQLLESVKSGKPGGVCRDVASAQAIMLNELGISRAYIVSFKAREGRHANVLVQDSQNSNNVIKINYGEANVASIETGSALLSQGESMPDYGLEYKIYNRGGRPITSITSELGNILKEGTSGEETTQIFLKQTSQNDRVLGIGIYDRWESQNLNIELGTSLFERVGTRNLTEIKQEGVYIRGLGELNTSYFFINPHFKVRMEMGGDFAYAYSTNSIKYADKGDSSFKKSNGEITEQSSASLGARSIFDRNDYQIESKIKSEFIPAFNNEVSAEKIVLAMSKIETEINFKRTLTRGLELKIGPKLIYRSFQNEAGIGNSYGLTTKLLFKELKLKGNISFMGPIEQNQARFLEGATNKLVIELSKTHHHVEYASTYEEDFDMGYYVILFSSGLRF